MKRIFLVLILLILIFGCSSENETEKTSSTINEPIIPNTATNDIQNKNDSIVIVRNGTDNHTRNDKCQTYKDITEIDNCYYKTGAGSHGDTGICDKIQNATIRQFCLFFYKTWVNNTYGCELESYHRDIRRSLRKVR